MSMKQTLTEKMNAETQTAIEAARKQLDEIEKRIGSLALLDEVDKARMALSNILVMLKKGENV